MSPTKGGVAGGHLSLAPATHPAAMGNRSNYRLPEERDRGLTKPDAAKAKELTEEAEN